MWLECVNLLDREKSRREASKHRSDYQTTRMKTIQKEKRALRKSNLSIK